ncbi:hypothetical protein N7478_003621 [Penicillium angulare]|uniref:uncharacterized protein n=1 Tax=Penicillium angulare TaxID=116970 RepID=UPI00253F7F81|nr:uncharacterized protein N7478_003621 [Penicillium angulare]KAJ5287935.1 hypothetical protein N7478_003621 [Penicillium angulare]
MAAPLSKDVTNLTGTWRLNRKLSDDPEGLLALQGVPWITRKALRLASLSLQMTQSVSMSDASSDGTSDGTNTSSDDDGFVTMLHVRQTVSPGSFNSDSSCPVNGQEQKLSLPIFGDIKMSLRYMNTSGIKDEVIRQQYEDGCPTKTVIDEDAVNLKMGWTAHVLWGFEIINGKRYLTRNATSSRNDETVAARMVYDYQE